MWIALCTPMLIMAFALSMERLEAPLTRRAPARAVRSRTRRRRWALFTRLRQPVMAEVVAVEAATP